MKDIQAFLQQLQPDSGKSASQVLFVTPGNSLSWYCDSSYCNYTIYDSFVFSSKTRPIIAPIFHTVDNLIRHVQNIGIINTPKFSIYDVFRVPKVSLNLLFVSQLYELGIDVNFSSRHCFVQYPHTGEDSWDWS